MIYAFRTKRERVSAFNRCLRRCVVETRKTGTLYIPVRHGHRSYMARRTSFSFGAKP